MEGDADSNIDAAANVLVAALVKQGIISGRWNPFEAGSLPAALNGPIWDSKNTAPIRIFVGEKP